MAGDKTFRMRFAGHGLPQLVALFALALPGISVFVPSSLAQAPTEYQVKAAFLYNFSKFVEWPQPSAEAAREPFVIGILGTDPFGDALEGIIQGKSANGRKLMIRKLRAAEDARTCQIVFISASESKRFRQELERMKGAGVLIVGEIPGLAEAGGMINFLVVENSVHFEINAEAAREAGLQISSRLLSLGRIVRSDRSGKKL